MPPNRIVALFTPFIALAAGIAATWLAEKVPEMNVSAGQLEAVFVAALAAVIAPAAQWLHGAQKFERRQQDIARAALEADAQASAHGDAGGLGDLGDEYADVEYDDGYADYDEDYDEAYADEDLDDDGYEAARDEPEPEPAVAVGG